MPGPVILAKGFQSVLHGAFIFAKAKQGPAAATDFFARMKRYLQTLFGIEAENNLEEKTS